MGLWSLERRQQEVPCPIRAGLQPSLPGMQGKVSFPMESCPRACSAAGAGRWPDQKQLLGEKCIENQLGEIFLITNHCCQARVSALLPTRQGFGWAVGSCPPGWPPCRAALPPGSTPEWSGARFPPSASEVPRAGSPQLRLLHVPRISHVAVTYLLVRRGAGVPPGGEEGRGVGGRCPWRRWVGKAEPRGRELLVPYRGCVRGGSTAGGQVWWSGMG